MTHDLRKRIERLEAARGRGAEEREQEGRSFSDYLAGLSYREFWAEVPGYLNALLARFPGVLDPHPDDPSDKAALRESLKVKIETDGVARLEHQELTRLSGFLAAHGRMIEERLLHDLDGETDPPHGCPRQANRATGKQGDKS